MSDARRCRRRLLALLAMSLCNQPAPRSVLAAEEGTNPVFQPAPIKAPEGFVIELAAAPPLVRYPMMACFDDRGRMFVAESDGLNLQNASEAEIARQSRRFVRLLEDTDGDGRFDRSTIFADGLTMPEGALWHDGAFYILSAPYLWRLEDTDGDGKADQRERIIGSMAVEGRQNQHGPYLGPTGRLFFSGGEFGYDLVGKDGRLAEGGRGWAGVFSCRPDGSDVEIVGHAGINPVEVVFSAEGEMFSTCNIIDGIDGRHDGLLHWVRGGLFHGLPRQPHPRRTGVYLPPVSRWGQVAPAGLVRLRGDMWGDEYRDNLFACQFNSHTVLRVRLERYGSTFRSRDEEFLTSPSIDFRPTDVLEDADGSLIVVDTGGWVIGGSCPLTKDLKSGVAGAIYRVRKAGTTSVADPRGLQLDWANTRPEQMLARLGDPRSAVRDRAVATLAGCGQGAVPALAQVFASAGSERSDSQGKAPLSVELRRNSVWALSRIGSPDAREALRRALGDSEATVRQAAAMSLGDLRDSRGAPALLPLLRDDVPSVRRATATALGQIGSTEAIPALFDALSREDNDDHLLHALTFALIETNAHDATAAGLSHASPRTRRAALIALDQMAGGRLTRELITPLLATDHQPLRRTAVEILGRRGWADQIPSLLREWLAEPKLAPEHAATARGAMAALSHDQRVQQVMIETLAADQRPSAAKVLVLEAVAESQITELPKGLVDLLGKLVSHGEAALRPPALAVLLAHHTTQLDPELEQLSRDASQQVTLRASALVILGRHGRAFDKESFKLLLSQLGDEAPPPDRMTGAEALAGAALDAGQLAELAERLAEIGPLELPILLRAFEKKPAAVADQALATQLIEALARSPGLTSLSAERLQKLAESMPPGPADAARTLIQRVKPDRVEQSNRLAQLEAQMAGGDPARGQTVFFGSRAACALCHRSGGRGGDLGPDLTQIGRIRTRHDLLEAIVFPDATLVNGYETLTVVTASGEILAGLFGQQTTDAVYLRAPGGVGRIRIPRKEIAAMAPSKTSVMPAGFDRALLLDELRDVVAYLQSLK